MIGLSLIGNSLTYGEEKISDGIHKTYYATGEIQYESHYKNGQLDGLTIEYNKDGTIKDKFYFKKDVLISKVAKDPARDIGRLSFLLRPWFWVLIIAATVGFWFLFSKILLKNKF